MVDESLDRPLPGDVCVMSTLTGMHLTASCLGLCLNLLNEDAIVMMISIDAHRLVGLALAATSSGFIRILPEEVDR